MASTISGAKGITFSGETFIVPQTHDMLKTLFNPTVRKSSFELMIVVLLLVNGLIFLIPNNSIRVNTFIGLYIFWRLNYDFGIGYLLRQQSLNHKMVNWAKKLNLFDNSNNSRLSKLVRFEIKSQMGSNYDIDDYPIEFNTWLIFRKFVDLILMSDFVTFMGLVVVCALKNDFQAVNTDQQSLWLIYLRMIIGSFLVIFNYWVKVNAHNTIKDYAWYWGDFFFRQINNEDLIFDGVFEMVPHPMYSVGYIGYYGFALMAKSYTVLTLACFGHFLQMVFLHFIENPHIDKIYGPSANEVDIVKLLKLKDLKHFDNVKPLIGLYNFNYLRGSDLMNLILVITYSIFIPLLCYFGQFLIDFKGYNLNSSCLLFGMTIAIKSFESFSINTLLLLQSYRKSFTKWYLTNNIPIEKSLNNWSIIYNSVISLTYSSFFGLNFYFCLVGLVDKDLFFQSYYYLRLFFGAVLLLTHVWINTSIIDSIGYFGWFYGDFFIPKSSLPHKAHLTKAGVYRYLNNPEQIFGVCGIMGITLIIPTYENVVLCLLWVLNNFIRINFIEKVHMIKLYGEEEVLKDSGVTKTFKKHLIPESIKRRLSHGDEKNNLLNQHRRKSSMMASATDTIDQLIKEMKKTNTKVSKQNVLELSQNLYFENSDYKLDVKNLNVSDMGENSLKSIEVGAPIEVEWQCPNDHSPKDWIALYKVAQTSFSRYKTLISSNSRWKWVDQESSNGLMKFDGDKLFWEEGIFEFRYHLEGKHDVAYISEPFEIKAPKLEIPNNSEEIYQFSKTLKAQVFDKVLKLDSINSSIIETVQNSDNILATYKRLAELISLTTGVKVTTKIFLYSDNDDLNILKLSSKLVHMKEVLDELSSSSSSSEQYAVDEIKKQQ